MRIGFAPCQGVSYTNLTHGGGTNIFTKGDWGQTLYVGGEGLFDDCEEKRMWAKQRFLQAKRTHRALKL